MAWDTAETRRRLKLAATTEFAAAGLHGTTMERIAGRAGLNKERLYSYFGTKERLFSTVLSDELAKIAEAVPLESLDVTDVGEFAGRVFDYHADHPELVRLLHWEALAYGDTEVPDEQARAAHYRRKAELFAAAQQAGTVDGGIDAPYLYFLLLSLAAWWSGASQVARMLTGADSADDRERARRRAATVAAARRLADPRALDRARTLPTA